MIAPTHFHNCISLRCTIDRTIQHSRGDLYMIAKHTIPNGLGSIQYLGAKVWKELPREIIKYLYLKMNRKHVFTVSFKPSTLHYTDFPFINFLVQKHFRNQAEGLFSLANLLRGSLLQILLYSSFSLVV